MFIHESLSYVIKKPFCISTDNVECLSIDLKMSERESILLNTVYRPPQGKTKELENYLNDITSSCPQRKCFLVETTTLTS